MHVKPVEIFRPMDVLNRFRELRNSKVKYKFVFYKASCPPLASTLLKLPIVAWTLRRGFTHRGKFQKLFNDRREMISNLVHTTSFPRNKKQRRRNISYKHWRYTFDKAAEKTDGRVLLPCPHVTAGDFLSFDESLFWSSLSLHDRLPAVRSKQFDRWRKTLRVRL